MFFHSRSCSWVLLGMIASDSHSRIVGMFFFISFPFPKFGNVFCSFPSRSRIEGMGFFQFPSFSRTLGMEWSIPVPVPDLQNVIPAHPCDISLIFCCKTGTEILKLEQQSAVYLVYFQIDLQTSIAIGRTGNCWLCDDHHYKCGNSIVGEFVKTWFISWYSNMDRTNWL